MSGLRNLFTNIGRRGFRSTALSRDTNKSTSSPLVKTPAESSSPPTPSGHGSTSAANAGGRFLTPTAVDRYYLVWSGQFKNRSDTPNQLEQHRITKAREWGRIRVNIYILLVAAGGCGIAMYLGKQAAKRGESVEKQNLAWHKEIKDEHNKQHGK